VQHAGVARAVSRRRPRAASWPAWLLALALLHAQALGLWHGIAHAAASGGAAVAAWQTAAWQTAARQAAEAQPDVFGHAVTDQGQCRLYDALGSAAGPCSTTGAPPVLIASAAPAVAPPQPPATYRPRPYEARAPPRG